MMRGRKEEVVGDDVGINRDVNYDRALSASSRDLGSTLREMGSHCRVQNRMVICSTPPSRPLPAHVGGVFVQIRSYRGFFTKTLSPFPKILPSINNNKL